MGIKLIMIQEQTGPKDIQKPLALQKSPWSCLILFLALVKIFPVFKYTSIVLILTV